MGKETSSRTSRKNLNDSKVKDSFLLDLPSMGEHASEFGPPTGPAAIATVYEESVRWLKLPWVQERLAERWEREQNRTGDPFIL